MTVNSVGANVAPSSASQILRGLNLVKRTENKNIDTSIIDLADRASVGQKGKSGITVALEDFGEVMQGFSKVDDCTYITQEGSKKSLKQKFFDALNKLLGNEVDENIYQTKDGQEKLAELPNNLGRLYQKDIFEQEMAEHQALQYQNSDDSIYDSALNFAKADIYAIEKANEKINGERYTVEINGSIEAGEIGTYNSDLDEYNKVGMVENMDLDGNVESISAEEYASYIIAADGLVKSDDGTISFDWHNVDGYVDCADSEYAASLSDEDFAKIAKDIYDKHYNK